MSNRTSLNAVHFGDMLLSPSAELAVVLRHLGGVQTQVGELVSQQQQKIEQLQWQLMRLRAQCVLERTQRLWGLSESNLLANSTGAKRFVANGEKIQHFLPVKAWRAAQKIICQTGCVGHAHPWLKDDGQCARTGQDCDAQTTEETRRCA